MTLLALAIFARRPLSAADPFANPFPYFTRSTSLALNTTPHPAVVRVLVQEAQAQASGSGSFVAARDRYGLVVTNWHVVREAAGKIEVVFPDRFRSAATVLKTDQDWDLAALLIWRPNVMPLAISPTAPQPGELLSIAGYGAGDYRCVAGKCTQYVSPSMHHPYEIVELAAQARQGDSGGPILNAQNELAGVLFGASRGSTSGSYCGRVRSFLATVWPDLDPHGSRRSGDAALVGLASAAPASNEADPAQTTLVPVEEPSQTDPMVPQPPSAPIPTREPVGPWAADLTPRDLQRETDPGLLRREDRAWELPDLPQTPLPSLEPTRSRGPNWEEWFGKTRYDQAKSVLAIIGILVVWGHLARWITK